uniref:Uncharacterized protein n=1 Tax=Lepeophtheirus salmonis TaxID=72036 RepID=A0A0K2VI48_LEPSM
MVQLQRISCHSGVHNCIRKLLEHIHIRKMAQLQQISFHSDAHNHIHRLLEPAARGIHWF